MLVIALLMALLTVFSGSKPQRDRLPVAAGSVVEATADAIVVTPPGKGATTYAVGDGWEIRGSGESRALVRTRQVNKFFNLANLMQVLVFTSFIAVMAVGATAVIVMGGIDLSMGSVYALSALLGAIALRYNWGLGFPEATINGRHWVWWGVVGVGLACLLFSPLSSMFAKPSPTAAPEAARGPEWRLVARWLGVAAICAAMWPIFTAMFNADSSARSRLSLPASIGLGVLVCCGVGAVLGLVNGSMVVGLRVHPFIITLGTMAAYRGMVALPTKAQSVGSLPERLQQGFFKQELPGLEGVTPIPVLIMLAVMLAGSFMLLRTVLGRRVFAVGGNETAAAYAGIPVGRVKVIIYTLMGALAGLAGFMYIGYFGAAETNAGQGYELKAIAAAVIGGASLSGGRGSAIGAVLGAILVGLIDNAIIILSIDQNYNQIILGAAIVAAVVLDQMKSRLLKAGK